LLFGGKTVFRVKLVSKIAGRGVQVDKFAETLLARPLDAVRKEIGALRVARKAV
jgi:hypothetical protein